MHINSGDKIISDIILFDNDGNGYKFKYVLDTGADITFITENVFNLLKLKSYSTGSMVGGDNNTKKTNLTKLNLTLPDYNKFIHVTVGVIPNRQEF